jgi:hypothetical protein
LQVRQLVGCDAITLAPPILEALASSTEPLTLKLSPVRLLKCHMLAQ